MIKKTELLKFESIQVLLLFLNEHINHSFITDDISYESPNNRFKEGRFIMVLKFECSVKVYLMWETLEQILWAYINPLGREDCLNFNLEAVDVINKKIAQTEAQLKEIKTIMKDKECGPSITPATPSDDVYRYSEQIKRYGTTKPTKKEVEILSVFKHLMEEDEL
jgi:hypothetical protein